MLSAEAGAGRFVVVSYSYTESGGVLGDGNRRWGLSPILLPLRRPEVPGWGPLLSFLILNGTQRVVTKPT